MDPEIRSNIWAVIAGYLGFIFAFLSPIRDNIANYMIVLGFLLTSILMSISLLFRLFRTFRRTHPLFFTFKLINLILIVLIFIGVLFGRLVGTWSPFWFLPFGYYVFLSSCVTYILFYDFTQLYALYQQTQLGRRIVESGKVEFIPSTSHEEITCECGREINPIFLFCPYCGRVVRREE